MCLLSFYPTGVEVEPEALRIASDSNPDGFGFAVMDLNHDRIIIRKSMKPDQLIDQFVKARKRHINAPALFHCRLTTDGITGKYNNHPFTVVDPNNPYDHRTVMGHNGIFPAEARPGKGDIRSDTRIVAETMAGSRWNLRTSEGRLAFGEWMGSYSKVAILTLDPTFNGHAFLINGHMGEWENGAWHSNTSYKWARSLKADWRYVGGAWYQVQSRDDYRPGHMYQNCQLCMAKGTVHNLTLFCGACHSCNECFRYTEECRCAPYWRELEEGRTDWGRERDSITVSQRLEALDDLMDELDDSGEDSVVTADGAIIWPKALGPGQVPTGWPEDSVDPYDSDDSVKLRQELEVLVAHVNNGGDI